MPAYLAHSGGPRTELKQVDGQIPVCESAFVTGWPGFLQAVVPSVEATAGVWVDDMDGFPRQPLLLSLLGFNVVALERQKAAIGKSHHIRQGMEANK
jgi:hypothetical protein